MYNTFIWHQDKGSHTDSGHGPTQTYRSSHRADIPEFITDIIHPFTSTYAHITQLQTPSWPTRQRHNTATPYLVSRKQASNDNLYQPSIIPPLHNMKLPPVQPLTRKLLIIQSVWSEFYLFYCLIKAPRTRYFQFYSTLLKFNIITFINS